MKARFLMAALASAAASMLVAGSARATLVAGWDFSQWLAPGALTIDGASGSNTLAANYSALDPTGNAGAESAAYGTLFFDGSNGSTFVDPFSAGPQFVPYGPGSLVSNLNAPTPNPFDSLTVLTSEGQAFANLLTMSAQAPVDVVFAARLTGVPQTGQAWALSFGGQTLSGSSAVAVSLSLDGSTYNPVQIVNLTNLDTAFTVSLGSFTAETVYVRLGLTPANGQPLIDNVALSADLISAPEPGVAVLLGAGLALVGLLRRRSA